MLTQITKFTLLSLEKKSAYIHNTVQLIHYTYVYGTFTSVCHGTDLVRVDFPTQNNFGKSALSISKSSTNAQRGLGLGSDWFTCVNRTKIVWFILKRTGLDV